MICVCLVKVTAESGLERNIYYAEKLEESEDNLWDLLLTLFWKTFYFMFGSLGIGFVFGFLGCLLLKYMRVITKQAKWETFFMLVVGFISYLVGDLWTSGVISIIATASMFAIYGWYNLSVQGR